MSWSCNCKLEISLSDTASGNRTGVIAILHAVCVAPCTGHLCWLQEIQGGGPWIHHCHRIGHLYVSTTFEYMTTHMHKYWLTHITNTHAHTDTHAHTHTHTHTHTDTTGTHHHAVSHTIMDVYTFMNTKFVYMHAHIQTTVTHHHAGSHTFMDMYTTMITTLVYMHMHTIQWNAHGKGWHNATPM